MPDNAIKALELKVDELILLCNQLNIENQNLKKKSLDWQEERSRLIENHAHVQERLKAMLNQLRNAESTL